jgi:hypothetical protein
MLKFPVGVWATILANKEYENEITTKAKLFHTLKHVTNFCEMLYEHYT